MPCFWSGLSIIGLYFFGNDLPSLCVAGLNLGPSEPLNSFFFSIFAEPTAVSHDKTFDNIAFLNRITGWTESTIRPLYFKGSGSSSIDDESAIPDSPCVQAFPDLPGIPYPRNWSVTGRPVLLEPFSQNFLTPRGHNPLQG